MCSHKESVVPSICNQHLLCLCLLTINVRVVHSCTKRTHLHTFVHRPTHPSTQPLTHSLAHHPLPMAQAYQSRASFGFQKRGTGRRVHKFECDWDRMKQVWVCGVSCFVVCLCVLHAGIFLLICMDVLVWRLLNVWGSGSNTVECLGFRIECC